MQNRYVGDVGDFGKHGLLRYLSGMTSNDDNPWLRLGVIWYMHHDERHGMDRRRINRDGRHVEFLERTLDCDQREYRDCDSVLWEGLRDLVFREARCVHCVQDAGILPADTQFHSTYLSYIPGGTTALRELRRNTRECWFQNALDATADADIICVDPDNGIGNDADMYTAKGPKFVYMADLQAIWKRGQSLVIYQHLGMVRGGAEVMVPVVVDQLRTGLEDAEPIPLMFHRGTARTFYVVPNPNHPDGQTHVDLIRARVDRFLDSHWQTHFEDAQR